MAIGNILIKNPFEMSMSKVINKLPTECEGAEWIEVDEEPLGEYKDYEFIVKSNYEVVIKGKGKLNRPKITNPIIETQGEPITSLSITITANGQAGKTIETVVEENSGTSLINNGDGTYTLSGITSNGTYIIKVTDSEGVTIIKNIVVNQFPITITVTSEGNGSVTGGGSYFVGEKANLVATANEGYEFSGWYIGETKISEDSTYQYEVTEEQTIMAKFQFNGVLVESITLNKNSIKVGKTGTTGEQLIASVLPENASNKSLVWEIVEEDKKSLATVANGNILGKGTEGTLTVRCKAEYGTADAYATCSVTIINGKTISNRDELEAISSNKSGSYILVKDIDLSGSNWTPISNFSGTLDGNGHVINNLTINTSNTSNTGMFASIETSTIKNLKLKNPSVNNSSTASQIGILFGVMSGSSTVNLEKVGIEGGSVSGKYIISSFGGNSSSGHKIKATDCYSTADVSPRNSHGYGLFAVSESGTCTIKNSYYYGNLRSTSYGGALTYSGQSATNCYYNSNNCLAASNGVGSALTTAQFTNKDNFSSWDFINTWIMKDGRPELRIFLSNQEIAELESN